MKVELVVIQGKPEGLVITLKGPQFLIGRDKNCNLRPSSDLVSKLHCGLQVLGRRVVVHDLGSKNGTFLNGKRIEDATSIHDGDLLRVGPLVFAVKISQDVSLPEKPVAGKDSENAALQWLVDDDPTVRNYEGDTLNPEQGSRSDHSDETVDERKRRQRQDVKRGHSDGDT